jgi:hypothetical protein
VVCHACYSFFYIICEYFYEYFYWLPEEFIWFLGGLRQLLDYSPRTELPFLWDYLCYLWSFSLRVFLLLISYSWEVVQKFFIDLNVPPIFKQYVICYFSIGIFILLITSSFLVFRFFLCSLYISALLLHLIRYFFYFLPGFFFNF